MKITKDEIKKEMLKPCLSFMENIKCELKQWFGEELRIDVDGQMIYIIDKNNKRYNEVLPAGRRAIILSFDMTNKEFDNTWLDCGARPYYDFVPHHIYEKIGTDLASLEIKQRTPISYTYKVVREYKSSIFITVDANNKDEARLKVQKEVDKAKYNEEFKDNMQHMLQFEYLDE